MRAAVSVYRRVATSSLPATRRAKAGVAAASALSAMGGEGAKVGKGGKGDRGDPQGLAEVAIRATGARVTQGRIQVLSVLQQADRALTHHEVEARVLAAAPLDRVTIYRVLDWLTREQIAHKIPGDDRVWRFTIAGRQQAHQHAHFQCTDCSQVICLDDVPSTLRPRLPAGYRSVGVEVTVKGQCRACVRPAARRKRR